MGGGGSQEATGGLRAPGRVAGGGAPQAATGPASNSSRPSRTTRTSVIAIIARRRLNARTRHLRVNIGFVIDAVDRGEIVLHYCPSASMFADMATAQRNPDTFERHRDMALG